MAIILFFGIVSSIISAFRDYLESLHLGCQFNQRGGEITMGAGNNHEYHAAKRILPLFLAVISLNGCAAAPETTMPTPPSVARKDLLTAALSPERVVARVEIKEVTLGPRLKAPLHLHPCPVVGVVTEGTIAFQIEGKPVLHLKAGDPFYEPANVRIARFDNDAAVPAKFSVFYLLGKDELELIRLLPK
jgi:quercetin dioxygenase-like cupin family protein